ncbi:SYC2L protein, partial [Ceuthmochares aereus]|nr:SYC2L protein [Ceuthmochares aereus]
SSYRKHLFSESNNENTSPGQSEKSWILDFQQPSLPKSLDYTRKRQKVKRRLKVLPLSSASSGSDYETKKQGAPMQRAQKEMLREKTTSSSKTENLSAVNHADEMSSEELEWSPVAVDVSGLVYSSDEEKATQVQYCHVPHAKTQISSETSSLLLPDILSGTIIKKPKISSWETNNLSSDASYKPRKPLDSVEKEMEIQTGKELHDSVDDAFSSKMLREDFTDSGVITAFESFIGQLKKFFWSRYQRMETSAQSALRTSEKNVSTLLNQIREC